MKKDKTMKIDSKKKDMVRLYINITNSCNANCEFCFMYSDSSKKTYMSFDKLKEIIDSHSKDFELQLEGGEPLMHPDLYLFMEYARSTGRLKKIIINTNGILLDEHLERLVAFHKYYSISISLKISINYWLYKLDSTIFEKGRDIYLATEYIDRFEVLFNVRLRHEDEKIVELLKENQIYDYSNVFYLQRYGRFENEMDYELPVIVQNIGDWFIYSCDGVCFDKDLIKRSKHEKELN